MKKRIFIYLYIILTEIVTIMFLPYIFGKGCTWIGIVGADIVSLTIVFFLKKISESIKEKDSYLYKIIIGIIITIIIVMILSSILYFV